MSSTGGCSKPPTNRPTSWLAESDIGPFMRFMPRALSHDSALRRSAPATSTSSMVSK